MTQKTTTAHLIGSHALGQAVVDEVHVPDDFRKERIQIRKILFRISELLQDQVLVYPGQLPGTSRSGETCGLVEHPERQADGFRPGFEPLASFCHILKLHRSPLARQLLSQFITARFLKQAESLSKIFISILIKDKKEVDGQKLKKSGTLNLIFDRIELKKKQICIRANLIAKI